jgi:hypothetical protein
MFVKAHRILFIVFFCAASFTCLMAQPIKKPLVKFKPPIVTTSLLNYSGKIASCFADEAKQLITFPIKVMDAKKNVYTIVSYGFAYTRIGVTEDEATGKAAPQSDVVGRNFTGLENPLPTVWQTNIIETIHQGEQLYFYDVFVKDNQNRMFIAPSLKISIK